MRAAPPEMPLMFPEKLLELGAPNGIVCSSGFERGQEPGINFYFASVGESDGPFWAVVNTDRMTRGDVKNYFSGLVGTDMAAELVDLEGSAGYYLVANPETDLPADLAVSPRLTMADYSEEVSRAHPEER